MHKIFRKTNFSHMRTRACVYHGVGNVSFSEDFADLLKEGPLMLITQRNVLRNLL